MPEVVLYFLRTPCADTWNTLALGRQNENVRNKCLCEGCVTGAVSAERRNLARLCTMMQVTCHSYIGRKTQRRSFFWPFPFQESYTSAFNSFLMCNFIRNKTAHLRGWHGSRCALEFKNEKHIMKVIFTP